MQTTQKPLIKQGVSYVLMLEKPTAQLYISESLSYFFGSKQIIKDISHKACTLLSGHTTNLIAHFDHVTINHVIPLLAFREKDQQTQIMRYFIRDDTA